jgi:hypothetical protein
MRPYDPPLRRGDNSNASPDALGQAEAATPRPTTTRAWPRFEATVAALLMSMSTALRRVGVNRTVHGFRTSFRTWSSEVSAQELSLKPLNRRRCRLHDRINDVPKYWIVKSGFHKGL